MTMTERASSERSVTYSFPSGWLLRSAQESTHTMRNDAQNARCAAPVDNDCVDNRTKQKPRADTRRRAATYHFLARQKRFGDNRRQSADNMIAAIDNNRLVHFFCDSLALTCMLRAAQTFLSFRSWRRSLILSPLLLVAVSSSPTCALPSTRFFSAVAMSNDWRSEVKLSKDESHVIWDKGTER